MEILFKYHNISNNSRECGAVGREVMRIAIIIAPESYAKCVSIPLTSNQQNSTFRRILCDTIPPEIPSRALKLCNPNKVDKIVFKVAIEFSGKRHFMASIGFKHNSISRALEAA
jgi:hypothetical protein